MTEIAIVRKNSREEIRVSIDDFKGHRFCHLRVWYLDGEEMRPGKHGLALRLELLPEILSALQKAITRGKGGDA